MRVCQVIFTALVLNGMVQVRCELDSAELCETDSGRDGRCVHVGQCPAAIQLIKRRLHPKLCRFERHEPVICCETEDNSIAKQKCAEYGIKSIPTTTTTTTTTTTPAPPGGLGALAHLFAIGGEDATPLEFPHMALLGYGNPDDIKWLCGGTLISENFVLTAAHCTRSRFGPVAYVKLGVHQISYITNFVQQFTIKNIIMHPEYTYAKHYHDIALLELDRDANIQGGVKPACLHTFEQLPSNALLATGWGAIELYEGIHDILQKVNLSYVPHSGCAGFYKPQDKLNEGLNDRWQLCADGGGRRADTCQGDSGGPLQLPLGDDSLHTVVGITSFGIKCAVVPAVYTRVSFYVPWIESVVWPK